MTQDLKTYVFEIDEYDVSGAPVAVDVSVVVVLTPARLPSSCHDGRTGCTTMLLVIAGGVDDDVTV